MDVRLWYLLCVAYVVASATSWSLAQRNRTGCVRGYQCVWDIHVNLNTEGTWPDFDSGLQKKIGFSFSVNRGITSALFHGLRVFCLSSFIYTNEKVIKENVTMKANFDFLCPLRITRWQSRNHRRTYGWQNFRNVPPESLLKYSTKLK